MHLRDVGFLRNVEYQKEPLGSDSEEAEGRAWKKNSNEKLKIATLKILSPLKNTRSVWVHFHNYHLQTR